MIKEAYIREMCMNMGCTRIELLKMFAEYQTNLTTMYAIILCITFILGLVIIGAGFYFYYIKKSCKYSNIGFILLLTGALAIFFGFFGCVIEIPEAIAFHNSPMAAAQYYLDAHVNIMKN